MAPPVKSGPRYNEMITAPKVRVIDDEGENLGILYTREAIEQAFELGLALVEVSPNADPAKVTRSRSRCASAAANFPTSSWV